MLFIDRSIARCSRLRKELFEQQATKKASLINLSDQTMNQGYGKKT